jgi:hypothetical protein
MLAAAPAPLHGMMQGVSSNRACFATLQAAGDMAEGTAQAQKGVAMAAWGCFAR